MRDLDIGRRFASAQATVADLDALAARTLAQRGPYLGAILALVRASDPALRAAAVRALDGVRGVPGVRAVVEALAHADVAVSTAAVGALRTTARDAPVRFAHALFHPRVEIRRAALGGELLAKVAEIAIYLRADPACADLARAIAWPQAMLMLAFELHAMDAMPDAELVERVLATPIAELRTVLSEERGRAAIAVDAYLPACAQEPTLVPPPGHDVLDQLVAAADERTFARLVEAVTPHRWLRVTRRAAVAMLGALARGGIARPGLLAACAALHPPVLGHAWLAPAHVPAAAAGIARHGWPARPTARDTERLLALPGVRDAGDGLPDLALAATLAGLYPAQRLRGLARAVGTNALIAALVARDAGWDIICQLPGEMPALELAWLGRVERASVPRYVALAGHALTTFTDKRLDAFIEGLAPAHRPQVLLAALLGMGGATDDRLAAVATTVAARFEQAGLAEALAQLLGAGAPPQASRLLIALVRATDDAAVGAAVAALDDDAARALVALFEGPDPPPRSRELAVATAYVAHRAPDVRAWAARATRLAEPGIALIRAVRASRALDDAERGAIATCAIGDLARALDPALDAPVSGVVPALALRAPAPSAVACAALLGCADAITDVARELDRHAGAAPRFDAQLDDATAASWLPVRELPPLAHARLWRWDAHTTALASWVAEQGGLLAAVRLADALPGWLARATLWRGIAEHVVMTRYRDRAQLARATPQELAAFAAERIDHPIGREAARIVVALVEAGAVAASDVRDRVLDRISDATSETRALLGRIVRTDGLPAPPPAAPALPARALMEQIRACTELDKLVAWCADTRPAIVQEAVLALLVLGAPGEARLAELLRGVTTLAAPLPVFASVSMWESAPAIAIAREVAAGAALKPAWQFHLCLALVARGDRDELPRVFAAMRAPADGWFRREDWEALVRVADPLACAIALADVAHHHAYQRAVAVLLGAEMAVAVLDALRAFVDVDADRPLHLRRGAARRLVEGGDLTALPILIEHVADEKGDDWAGAAKVVPVVAHTEAWERLVDVALIGGDPACSEKRMLAVLALWPAPDPPRAAALWARILDEASTSTARRAAAAHAVSALEAQDRLGRVADVFAWGVRRGVELTGKLFRVHMTSSEKDLGHTYLDNSARVFVSPLPMLRGEAHGQDVVEGLILHELGHHVYHRGEAAQALWKKAHAEGIGHLLNLVADEHLERNLRALDRSYGDRLKRLDAYAFQHAPQELLLAKLLASLRGSAARALIAAELGVAFHEAAVRLRRGAILGELARAGHPLARFARALRMGLGNREGDPLVEQALELCGGKDLRRHDMQALYDLTRQLADLFGGAVAVAHVFGGPEGLGFGERDDDVFGGGVSDEALQKEVDRVLDPRSRKASGARSDKPSDRLWINVAPEAEFDRITRVERLRGDPALHAALALAVRRHASRLRAQLDDLGLRWQPQKARTQGRALDRSRLRALVTRGDPRILIAREPVRRTDLFLGVIVDCSGSMQAGQNIERAKKFAVLVAEACRLVTGVEARFFGFTDSIIYDAGDAADCAVTALRADGGNNDAAALYYAAQIAAASRRRARILVMISDGLPTECSVDALRALVTDLSRRRGILCAQVAVRALDEVCFPHYVVMDDANPDVAVARFGRMIAMLAGKALGAG